MLRGLGHKVYKSSLSVETGRYPCDFKVHLSVSLRWRVCSDWDLPRGGYPCVSGVLRGHSNRYHGRTLRVPSLGSTNVVTHPPSSSEEGVQEKPRDPDKL